MQTPEQHSEPVLHGLHLAPQETAACTAVGAVIDITIGRAIAAPIPMRRTASLLDIPLFDIICSGQTASCNK